MTENKQLICHHMAEALKQTRQWDNIRDIVYYPGSQEAIIQFEKGPNKIVKAEFDSGWGLIHDIINALV